MPERVWVEGPSRVRAARIAFSKPLGARVEYIRHDLVPTAKPDADRQLNVRDQVALAALQGVAPQINGEHFCNPIEYVTEAFEIADAFLAERDRRDG